MWCLSLRPLRKAVQNVKIGVVWALRRGRWKCETWKCEKRDSMEHRVLHMSVHCRAGMHKSTRKSTRFRRQLWVPHLPVWDYHGSASVLVWLWWLKQSSHDVDFQLLTFFLHLHKLCCQLCCQLCCTDYIFIIQFYSSYICHLPVCVLVVLEVLMAAVQSI